MIRVYGSAICITVFWERSRLMRRKAMLDQRKPRAAHEVSGGC
jgi:hypothetical protein